MPTSATHRPTCSGDKVRFTPSVSTTSAEPQSEAPLRPDIERLPCLATLSPAPATTNAVAVETLNVPDASPPVPHVSTSISRSVPVRAAVSSARVCTLATFERITCAKPISSSTVSPFIRSAVRNAAICASVAVPDMIASIAPAASMRVRSRRSTRTRVASVMIGLVMLAPSTPPGVHKSSTSVSNADLRRSPHGASSMGMVAATPAVLLAGAAQVVEVGRTQPVEPAADRLGSELVVRRTLVRQRRVGGQDGHAPAEGQGERIGGVAHHRHVAAVAPDHQRRVHALVIAVDLGAHELEAAGFGDLADQVEDRHPGAAGLAQHPSQTVRLGHRQIERTPAAPVDGFEEHHGTGGLTTRAQIDDAHLRHFVTPPVENSLWSQSIRRFFS